MPVPCQGHENIRDTKQRNSKKDSQNLGFYWL